MEDRAGRSIDHAAYEARRAGKTPINFARNHCEAPKKDGRICNKPCGASKRCGKHKGQ